MAESLRTVVYSVKVNTEGAKKGGRDMQITMRTMQSDATKANETMKALGNTIAAEYGVKVKVAADNTRAAKAELRASANEASKASKNYKQLSDEYNLLSSMIGKSADEQQVLNAVFRLGAGATEEQRKRVETLVRSYQQQRDALNKTQGSFRGLRGQMQNFGYQMQDVAVQVGMGTNAFTILSQQGSQFAAGFGPTGAVVGAGIAVAGVIGSLLVPNLLKGSKATDELTDKLKELAEASGLTEEMASTLINKEYEKVLGLEKSSAALKKEIDNVTISNKTYKEYVEQQKKAAEAARVTANMTTTGFENAIKTEQEWADAQRKSKQELTDKITKYQTQRTQINESVKLQDMYTAAIGRGTKTTKEWAEENKKLVKAAKDRADAAGLSNSQLLEQQKIEEIALLTKQEASAADIESLKTSYDIQIAEARRVEITKELIKETAERTKATAKALAKQKEELALINEKNALLARLDIGDTSALDAKYAKESKLLGDNLKAQKALREQYDRDVLKAQGTSWEKYLVNIEDQLKSTDEIMIASVDRFTKGFGNAFANAVFESDNLGDAMANIFEDVGKNMVAFFAEWAAQELTLWALKKAIGTATGTAQGVAMTSTAEASSLMASLNAFAATAAIPIVGPILAPGAAAAALAATQPMVAAISGLSFAGAFDKGGVIPQNALGIVSEYGDELVNGVLVRGGAGGTRVTGREDTSRMMGSSTSNSITINSSGNASPEAIARAVARSLKKSNKKLDTAVYDSVNRGSNNRGKRFA